MSWCGQPWTSDELVNAGALDVVYARWPYAERFLIERAHHSAADEHGVWHAKPAHLDHCCTDENRYPGLTRVDDAGRAHVPAVPNRWPRCPMCDAPLNRIKMSDQWHCAPPQMSHLELASA